jgi:hypothetical protein
MFPGITCYEHEGGRICADEPLFPGRAPRRAAAGSRRCNTVAGGRTRVVEGREASCLFGVVTCRHIRR